MRQDGVNSDAKTMIARATSTFLEIANSDDDDCRVLESK
jgi:hypothetical protein